MIIIQIEIKWNVILIIYLKKYNINMYNLLKRKYTLTKI